MTQNALIMKAKNFSAKYKTKMTIKIFFFRIFRVFRGKILTSQAVSKKQFENCEI